MDTRRVRSPPPGWPQTSRAFYRPSPSPALADNAAPLSARTNERWAFYSSAAIPRGHPARENAFGASCAALMELVLSNNQGELSPLEIGMHALKAVPKSEGGRGKKGGLAEYARMIGKQKQHVGTYRKAAEVLQQAMSINSNIDVTVYLDKAQHLAVIADLPEWMQSIAAEFCIKDKWSVADAKYWNIPIL